MKLFGAGKNRPPHRAESIGRETEPMRAKQPPKYNRRTAGNVFFALFAAVAMVGAVGYGFNTVLRGPVKSMTDVTRRTVAESTIVTSSRLAIVGATTQQTEADCDADGMVEPMPYRDAGTLPHPVGGGYLPTGLVPDSIDPWKTEFGYCAWDAGTITVSNNAAGCGGSTAKRLNGAPNGSQNSIAIISAGKNKKFETICSAYVDTTPADGKPDTVMLNKPAGSDDIVLGYTYAEANDLGQGMWKPIEKDVDGDGTPDDVATTRNAIEGTKDASFGGAVNLKGNVLTGGGLVLPGDPGDDTLTGPCNSANDKQIRRNTATVPPTLEICNFAGGLGWSPLSGSAGGGGSGGGMTGGLVSHWRLDQTSGTVVPDSAGTNPGTTVNGPTWIEDGATGGALNFVASPSWQRVHIPRSTSLEPTAVSVSTWIKPTGSLVNATAISKAINSGSPSYGIWFRANGKPFFIINTSGPGGDNAVDAASGIPTGQWTHIAATYDPSANAPQLKIYINGVLDGANTDTGPLMYDTTAAGNLFLGSGGPNDWNATLNAALDDVRVYNYAISEVEVHNLFNTTKPPIRRSTNQTKSGYLVSWGGAQGYGTTGTGINNSLDHTPRLIGRDFIQASAAMTHGCAVKVDGTVWCWGYNADGRAGNDVVDHLSPTKVTGLSDVMQVSATTQNTCALKRNGEAWCWGQRASGQLGNGTSGVASVPTPVKVSNINDFIALSTGGQNAMCGIRQNGEGWCWGQNSGGQFGNGASGTTSAVPVKISNINNWAQLSLGAAGTGGTCGVTRTGEAYCWGTEGSGENGNGATSAVQLVPARVVYDGSGNYWKDWVKVVRATSNACGLRSNGQIWCWGSDANGELGNGTVTTGNQVLPVQVSDFSDFINVSQPFGAGSAVSFCGTRKNGESYCWGTDNSSAGALGNGSAITANQTSPSQLKGVNFTDISIGYGWGVGIMDNNVRPISDTAKPQQLLGAGSTNNRCAITNDRSAWCWGSDTNGALGNGAVTGTKAAPSKIAEAGPWAQIVSNSATSCGIKTNGTLWCWGQNEIIGYMGVGTTTANYPSPVQVVTTVPANTNPWSALSTGAAGCAIKTDGTLWCWGSGANGRVGDGTISNRLSPVQVGADKKWLKVTTSPNTTCAIATDRRLWCWGDNSQGQLGLGAAAFGDNSLPLLVPDPGPWYDVVTTSQETCGVKMDGTAWCWGYAVNTKLGNNQSTGNAPSPQLIAEPGPWRMVAPGGSNGCGLKVDGSAWCWGNNSSGILGMGISGGIYNYPVRVLGGNDWVEVRPSGLGNCGIKKDDSIWCWGFDTNSILGNGVYNTANLAYPTRVNTIPLRDPWMPAEHGGGFDLLPGVDAVLGSSRFISDDGGANKGLQFLPSGRSLLRSTALHSQLTLESISEPGLGTYDQDSGQMLSASKDTPSSQITFQASAAQGIGWRPVAPYAVSFDATDYISGTVTGDAANDNDKFLMSFWFRIHPDTPQIRMLVYNGYNGTTRAQISLEDGLDGSASDGLWQLRLQLGSSSTLLTAGDGMGIRTNNTITEGVWHHALISVDTTNLITHLYIDDVSNVRNNDKTMVAGMIDFGANQSFSNASDSLDADISEMQIDVGTYLDFSIEDNRRLYINNKGGPVQYGAWISGPTPDIYMVDGYATWHNNTSGGAGPFTVTTGALSAATTTPMNGTQYTTTRIDRFVGTDMASGNFKMAHHPVWSTDGGAWLGNLDADIEVTAAGNMGIGTFGSPQARLDVNGAIKIGDDATCTASKDGMINWNGTKMQFCSGGSWKDFGHYAGSTYWSSISTAQESRCAISHGGAAYCWGQAYNGQLGDNQTATARTTPAGLHSDSSASGWSNWIQMAGARRTRCGLRSDGTAWCWGENDVGQIGNNTVGTDALRPTQVHSSSSATGWTDWVQVITGGYYSCGLRSNGTVWCWGHWSYTGANNNNGAYDYARRPVQVHTNTGPGGWSDWKSISGGVGAHACGIRTNGTAWCWGMVGEGAAGDGVVRGSFDTVPRPVQVQDDTGPGVWSDWVQLSAANSFTCGIRTNGTAWCWGDNTSGRLGVGTSALRRRPTQVRDSAGTGYWTDWVQISAGSGGACGIRTNGELYCWGSSFGGQLGNNQNTVDSNKPVLVHSDVSATGWTDWVAVSANEVNCGIRTDGSLWCWGNGHNGNGGTGAMRPVKVSEP